jgi:hypothetical protein
VAVYRIEMPVPCWPVEDRLQIGDHAIFHLRYEERWRYQVPNGWEPLGLLFPPDPFHPNAKPSLRGALCLGDLEAGIPPVEIIKLGYFTLSLQAVQLDESDPNGVLNSQACDFFRAHEEYMPLTRAGLYEPLEPNPRS